MASHCTVSPKLTPGQSLSKASVPTHRSASTQGGALSSSIMDWLMASNSPPENPSSPQATLPALCKYRALLATDAGLVWQRFVHACTTPCPRSLFDKRADTNACMRVPSAHGTNGLRDGNSLVARSVGGQFCGQEGCVCAIARKRTGLRPE